MGDSRFISWLGSSFNTNLIGLRNAEGISEALLCLSCNLISRGLNDEVSDLIKGLIPHSLPCVVASLEMVEGQEGAAGGSRSLERLRRYVTLALSVFFHSLLLSNKK